MRSPQRRLLGSTPEEVLSSPGFWLAKLHPDDRERFSDTLDRAVAERGLISAMRPELGLELAGEHHPDLVLLDLHLPDIPGETVLHRLQTNPKTAAIPVVILSADARPGLIQRLLEQGARAFLTKPLAVKELLEVLDTVAAEREQARAG